MLSLLYNLIISPIEIIVEIILGVMYSILHNYGLAIIAVSLVIQTLILPLYKRSDAIQDEERARQKAMSHWVDHIKKTFKGDERYMILSAYYRQQGYKSWYALGSSVSILLQIPFFIAAYHYLSNFRDFAGHSFLFIRDLGAEDATFVIGSFAVNVLPILMTLINLLSGAVYTKTLPFREKVQVYGLAAVFLVLLYKSPSGLVLYWTMNNLYSLGKNLVMKVFAAAFPKRRTAKNADLQAGNENRIFLWTGLYLTLLMGAMIPMAVVKSSATEFITDTYGPGTLIANNIAIVAGYFLLWGGIFFWLMKKKIRKAFAGTLFVLSVLGTIDYLFFGTGLGTMTTFFAYEWGLNLTRNEKILNLGILVAVTVVLILILKKKQAAAERILQILCVSMAGMCVINAFSIRSQVAKYENQKRQYAQPGEQILELSRSGRNVIVLMLDRAIDGYVPFLFDEKPELLESFSGFTWYPDTLSFGKCTNLGAPALYGGYDYTPAAMDARSDILLKDKNNEALMVLPTLLKEEGYEVTVCDPPYAGTYEWIPDYSMYYEAGIKAYTTEGAYSRAYFEPFSAAYSAVQQHAAFYYSVLKVLPPAIQRFWYRDGFYFEQEQEAVNKEFLRCYSVMDNLVSITKVTSEDKNCFLQMQNGMTHDVTTLSKPDYEPAAGISHTVLTLTMGPEYTLEKTIDDRSLSISNAYQMGHYDSNMAALITLGTWFDYLKEQGCWDNTRIILVSDHGRELRDLGMENETAGIDVEAFNPLLMVKDFGAAGFTVSDEYMTNADVPALALSGIAENPVNPFTGNAISMEKKQTPLAVTTSMHWDVTGDQRTVFDLSDGVWFEVSPGNIFEDSNWRRLDD